MDSEIVGFPLCCHPDQATARGGIFASHDCFADGKCADPSTSFHCARDDKGGQKFATSADFNCRESLSAIKAINSELVGFPLVLLTV